MPIAKEKVAEMLPLMNKSKFVVLDLETSGLSPEKGGRIIEIGAVLLEDGKIVDTFETFVNPEQKIYGKTTELTGITNEMLVGKPPIGQVLPEFYKFIGDAVIVAHNADFDWNRFLTYFFKKVGIHPNNRVIDTLLLSKYFFPNNKKHNLEILCSELGVVLEQHHRALSDTKATAECLVKMKEKFAHLIPNVDIETLDTMSEQIGLFGEILDNVDDITKHKTNVNKLSIKRVKYWEKPINKQKVYRRLYVSINDGTMFGTTYFDIPTKTWYNKDFPTSLDFEMVNTLVLKFLNLKSTEELCSFRN